MPLFVKVIFRSLYKLSPKFLCEKCSLFMSFNLMSWLVGSSERYSLIPSSNAVVNTNIVDSNSSNILQSYAISDSGTISIIDDDNHHNHINANHGSSYSNNADHVRSKTWISGVKLLECRYLKDSGCKSACIHLCKGPTQQFFQDELGENLCSICSFLASQVKCIVMKSEHLLLISNDSD